MNQIQQIQSILGVTPDGVFGPISAAALQDANGNQLAAIQDALGVTQDGIFGPVSHAALNALIGPAVPAGAPQRVIASEFATDKDLRAYNAAIAEGKSQQEAFAVGDNCIGCWGDSTNVPSPICALPPEIMDRTWGAPWTATGKHKQVKLVNPATGASTIATVADVMPHLDDITNGAGIDLNPAACQALGLPDGAMVPVTWQPA